jgi:sec-independent protein translocase protein TatC
LILAAIITPPDVASQIIVAIPVLILYEISIKVSKRVIKNQQKNANK